MANLQGFVVNWASWDTAAADLAEVAWMARSHARSAAINAERAEIASERFLPPWTVMADARNRTQSARALGEPQLQDPLPRARPSPCPVGSVSVGMVGKLYLEF